MQLQHPIYNPASPGTLQLHTYELIFQLITIFHAIEENTKDPFLVPKLVFPNTIPLKPTYFFPHFHVLR